MPVNLETIRKSLRTLEETLSVLSGPEYCQVSAMAQHGLLSGAVQDFNVCFEVCWRSMRRWLLENASLTDMETLTRKQLLRLAAQYGLISSYETWVAHMEARNRMAHTYDHEIAVEVAQAAYGFAADARHLLAALEERDA